MINFYFNHDPALLPEYSDACHPVQLFNTHPHNKAKYSRASGTLLKRVRDLGVEIDANAIDFITIASAVTAAETFERRSVAADAWSRVMHLHIPVTDHYLWNTLSNRLSSILNFLTGDQWQFTFTKTTFQMPAPIISKKSKARLDSLKGLNSVCLFSGGLDSAVGAIDILNGPSNYKPLLLSHAYRGDGVKQESIKKLLKSNFGELSYSISPSLMSKLKGKTDVTMRGRSFNFLAMAVLGISALRNANEDSSINTIIVPENGYISINPPLTRRRIGSHSTRTTHPYFLNRLEELLKDAGLNIQFINPYQFKTKGEMLAECLDQDAIAKAVPLSVSCSHWHRKHMQCGHCVPCLIRRASVHHAGFIADAPYVSQNLKFIHKEKDIRDDLHAVQTAIIRLDKSKDYKGWVRQSGSLPDDQVTRNKLESTIQRGLKEVETFLKANNV
ncbi:Qat anti-phage system QueC-like protein QatC [Pseudoalteromonas peptidolytica]|uniref:Qat anti-phage system QueC-like protein QatC n=1 Tax=Pseudoalteromonas peptidolytica TaxID=61150 RepID=UPI00298DAFC8|nr:Qat anti-phage system QueC-like protein QatC [Pseudoalteromonas peptidolytica]MDW7551507.1 Qat anti-phage system QueC-like protein QatC [Pseudoalteromonas peptidolytica]